MLAGGVGIAALGTLATGGDAHARASRKLFRHGVASGDPLPRAVVLWTRVTPTSDATPGSGKGPAVTVTWQVARDPRFRHVVRSGQVVTTAHLDHTVKVDARGLASDHWYYYRFLVDGVSSPVGRTRTAPRTTADTARLRVGVVSCANWEQGYFAAYRHLAAHPGLDAVVHLGDYLYEGRHRRSAIRPHVPQHELETLDDYRMRHGQYKTDPDLQLLHAQVPFIVTWDDHEVSNDCWSHGGPNDDSSEARFDVRKSHAHRAYDEWMPVRMDGTARVDDGTALFRQLRWGRLADIAMLDLRSYRDQQAQADGTAEPAEHQSEVDDPTRTITGNQQMAWLKQVLLNRSTRWKLVGNSVLIAPVTYAQLPRDSVRAIRLFTEGVGDDGVSFNADAWDGYTADRHELFDHIAKNKVENAVFLTGDFHSAWANELPLDTGSYPASGTAGVEFVCTSVTSDNMDDVGGDQARTMTLTTEATVQSNNRHVKYLNLDDHGYSVLDVTRERAQMDYYVLADKRRADSGVSYGASWLTHAGSGKVIAGERPAH